MERERQLAVREAASPHRAAVVAILAETLLDLLVPAPGVAARGRKALKSRSQPALVSTGGGKRTRTRPGR